MAHKAEVLAFDREKRVYKDAHVDNFRRKRHFPVIAAIGAGRSDGDSIILVQESAGAAMSSATPRDNLRSKLSDVPSRLIPKDPLDEMFPTASPLSSFRNAVMCKHTKARQDKAANVASPLFTSTSDSQSSTFEDRYHVAKTKPLFIPASAAEAKSMIERKPFYDGEAYTRPPPVGRSFAPPVGKTDWSYNNPVVAREDIGTKTYFHLPPEGVITADRRYTQEFIQQHVDAYQLSRRRAS